MAVVLQTSTMLVQIINSYNLVSTLPLNVVTQYKFLCNVKIKMYIASSNTVSGYSPMQTFYKAIKATEKRLKINTHW